MSSVRPLSPGTLDMVHGSTPMKDSPYFWLSIIVRKYGVCFDRRRASARSATYCSNYGYICTHGTKDVKTLSEFGVGSGESHSWASLYSSSSVIHSLEFSTKLAQFVGVLFLFMNGTVVKWLPNTTWYWGDMWPVLWLRIRATVPECDGEWLTYMPSLERGSYFGTVLKLDCSLLSSTKHGLPKVWHVEGSMMSPSILKKVASLLQLSPRIINLYYLNATRFKANGHIIVVVWLDQWQSACRRRFRVISMRVFIFCSSMPFWWWVPTAQYVIF